MSGTYIATADPAIPAAVVWHVLDPEAQTETIEQ